MSLPPSGSNLQSLFTELALGIRGQLLEHFRRFPVNGPGGLMVTKDMTCYANLLKSWDLEGDEIKAAIDVLLEVGSLFVVGPEALREKLRGGGPTAAASNNDGTTTAGRGAPTTDVSNGFALSAQDVRAYVMRRVDTNTVAMQSVLSSL